MEQSLSEKFYSHMNQAAEFESIVSTILGTNYNISEIKNESSQRADLVAENGVFFEIKYSYQHNFNSLLNLIKNYNYVNPNPLMNLTIYVTNISKTSTDSRVENDLECNKHSINIITIENLLYLCNNNDKLKQKLLKCLNISTENIIAQPLDKSIEKLLSKSKKKTVHKTPIKTISAKKLDSILCGTVKTSFKKYEKFCEELVKQIFADSLENITAQKYNNQGLYKFDLIAALKENPQSFWKFIYDKFNSSFIVFECKNYSDKITQKEIYYTERYLYNNALRNVAIIFTRKGIDKHGCIAVQGILKEHGKLILVLNDEDIKELINAYESREKGDLTKPSPSDLLFIRAKEFLLNLDK